MTSLTLPGLLQRLSTSTSPALTWYARNGERVELSGRVLVQWVAKTAHFAADAGLDAGDTLAVSLDRHWRAPVWWLAAWYSGLTVASGPGVTPQATVTPDTPEAPRGSGVRIVVALPALAMRATQLPEGAVDYVAEVRSFPDQLPYPGPAPDPAVIDPAGHSLTLDELLTGGTPTRRLLPPDAGPADLTSTWAAGGSVVWHDGLDPEALARVQTSEGAA